MRKTIKIKFEYRITFIYFLIGILWILFSDTVFGFLIADPVLLTKLSIVKGLLYVIITSLLLCSLVKKHLKEVSKANKTIEQRNIELENMNSELKTMYDKMQKSEEKFRKAVLRNPDAISINKLSEGEFIMANYGFENMFEYTINEVIGKKISELNIWDNIDEREKYISILREKGVIENLEVKFKSKSNKIIYGIISAATIEIEGILHSINIVKDITELKKVQVELKIAREKAEESDKLKTQFILNMTHEVRTPMNAIIGFSQMLNKEKLTEEKIKYYTSIIIKSSQHLQTLVDNLLLISALESKVEKVNLESVCVNELLSELEAVFNFQAQKKDLQLFCKKSLNDVESTIKTDRTKLKQILSNLITNAFKFTLRGSVEFGYVYKNNFVEFYVNDSGIGIKPELQSKIFERFIQAETELSKLAGGNGLGLSISKGFVELLGGKIWVESELGKGSTFYFTIPYKTN